MKPSSAPRTLATHPEPPAQSSLFFFQLPGQRQKNALEFQRAVDKLFSFGGFRGEQEENPVHLARNFRALAGFSDEEIEDLVEASAEAYAEAQAMQQANAGQ